ncbi:MAG: MFS transporter, partial [Candidatus Bathyarchaeota archaeon]|nr:MFS transporter [Candidatus Bathyarchaeota archaeon]
GRLSDKVGRRPVILLSIFSSAVSFIIFALADSFVFLLLSRIAAGMATEAGVAQAYIADITEEHERTSGMGKVGAANGAGFIIGPALGGLLSIYGFSATGYAAAALTAVNFVFAFFFLPESNSRKHVNTETVEKQGGYWRRLLSTVTNPALRIVFMITFIVIFAFSAIPVLAPLLGQSYFGFTELEMSYVFMYIGFIQIILQGFLIGRFTKRWGEGNLITIGTLSMAVGVFCLPLFQNLVSFFITLTMMSSGIGTLNTVLPSFISKRAPADEQGGILGVAQSVGSIARIPGPLVAGVIAQFAGLNIAFAVSALIVFVGFVLGLKVFSEEKHGEPTN